MHNEWHALQVPNKQSVSYFWFCYLHLLIAFAVAVATDTTHLHHADPPRANFVVFLHQIFVFFPVTQYTENYAKVRRLTKDTALNITVDDVVHII